MYLLDGFTESVECPEPVAEPHFLIEMSEHAQLEWDDENDCSKEGRVLSVDLVVSATERRSLIPTGYDFDLPATEEGWTEIVAAMHRWADGRGFNFIEPTTSFVLDPTSPGANAAVHLFVRVASPVRSRWMPPTIRASSHERSRPTGTSVPDALVSSSHAPQRRHGVRKLPSDRPVLPDMGRARRTRTISERLRLGRVDAGLNCSPQTPGGDTSTRTD